MDIEACEILRKCGNLLTSEAGQKGLLVDIVKRSYRTSGSGSLGGGSSDLQQSSKRQRFDQGNDKDSIGGREMAQFCRAQSREVTRGCLSFLGLLAVELAAPCAFAQTLYDRPVLVTDLQMHTARTRAAMDPEGRFLVTGHLIKPCGSGRHPTESYYGLFECPRGQITSEKSIRSR